MATKTEKAAPTSEGMTLLDFSASWCGPCREQKKVLKKFSEKRPDVKVEFIDMDTVDGELRGEKYKVQALPTLVILKDGKKKDQWEGLTSLKELLEKFKEAPKP